MVHLSAFLSISVAHSLEAHEPRLGLSVEVLDELQAIRNASALNESAYRDAAQFLLMAHDRLADLARRIRDRLE